MKRPVLSLPLHVVPHVSPETGVECPVSLVANDGRLLATFAKGTKSEAQEAVATACNRIQDTVDALEAGENVLIRCLADLRAQGSVGEDGLVADVVRVLSEISVVRLRNVRDGLAPSACG